MVLSTPLLLDVVCALAGIWAALVAWVRLGRLESDLLALVDDETPSVRYWALTLLARATDLTGPIEQAALRRIRDADPATRAAAGTLLGRATSAPAAAALRQLLFDDTFF